MKKIHGEDSEVSQELTKSYFMYRFNYQTKFVFLEKFLGITISLQTLKRRLADYEKNFTKSVEKFFEEIENFITSLPVNNHSVGTPEKEKEREREYPLVVELLKSRVSTLEKQLAEKDAIIDFLLNQKVQNEIDNTTFISKISNSDTQRDKKPTNSNNKN